MTEEEESIHELSHALLKRYIDKARKDKTKTLTMKKFSVNKKDTPDNEKHWDKLDRRFNKRDKGIGKASDLIQDDLELRDLFQELQLIALEDRLVEELEKYYSPEVSIEDVESLMVQDEGDFT